MSATVQSGRQLIEAAKAALDDSHTVNVYIESFGRPVPVSSVEINGDTVKLEGAGNIVYHVALPAILAVGTANLSGAPSRRPPPDFAALSSKLA